MGPAGLDRQTFEAEVGRLVEAGYRLALGMLRNRAEAEDAVQEAVINAWRKVDTFRPGGSVQAWFLGIVANQCRTRRRRWRAVVRGAADDTVSQGPEADVIERIEVRRALRRLDHAHRLVVVLRYYLDLPFEEVAAVAGIPEGTAKSRLHRAVGILRRELGAGESPGVEE
jgi:RNA polymerase sigma-70 factor, ECF subfamily